MGFVVEGEDLLGQLVVGGKIFGWEGVYQIAAVFEEDFLGGEPGGVEGSEREGVVFDAGGLGVGEGVVEVQGVGGYIGGEDGIGAGAETTVDEVGVGEDTHQEEG